jgi:hypothetical protein
MAAQRAFVTPAKNYPTNPISTKQGVDVSVLYDHTLVHVDAPFR